MAARRFESSAGNGRVSDEDESVQLLPSLTSPSRRIKAQQAPPTDGVSNATYLFLYAFLLFLLLCAVMLHLFSHHMSALSARHVEDLSIAAHWVRQYRVEALFDWTWHHNGDYQRHLTHISQLASRPAPLISASPTFVDEPTVVNDAVAYLTAHPSEGVVVDYVRQLHNPSPHPLPRAKDWPATCQALKIASEWAMCKLQPHELNDWLPATTHVLTVAVYDAYVDSGSCHEAVPGTPFTATATYHFQRWTNNGCHNSAIKAIRQQPVHHYRELIDTVGTYLGATGHFAPQQLPRIIRSLAVTPVTAKVLVAKGGIADKLMDVLVDRRVVTRDRIVQYESGTYSADVVYRTDTWPYLTDKYNHYAHDRTDMQLVHRTLVDDLPDQQRDLIVVLRREGSRHIQQHDKIVAYIAEQLEVRLKSAGLQVAVFDGAGHVRDHIALFQRARVMIGPHGAGMLNLYWLKPGSAVVEVGYDEGMTYPEMYAEMALHSDHHYYVVKGTGSYDGEISMDWDDWEWAWNSIVAGLQAAEKQRTVEAAPAPVSG